MTDDYLAWLLERDDANPAVRYFTLRWLRGEAPDSAAVVEAGAAVMRSGPVPKVLAAQHPDGYWLRPGSGYSDKYRGTVWQIVLLNRLGADPEDSRVRRACEYVIKHTQNADGAFDRAGATDEPSQASKAFHCLNGNLLAALIGLGWLDDARIQRAIEWEAHAITGDDPAFRYQRFGTSGPGFECASNHGLPCAWGANKALLGLLAVPEERRSPAVEMALEAGAAFLLSHDPAVADYPYFARVSDKWFRFGLPLSYWSDVLETLEVLTGLGYGQDARLDGAFECVLSKRDENGRWHLEDTINGRAWARIETRDAPSKWVTLRAIRVLQAADRLP